MPSPAPCPRPLLNPPGLRPATTPLPLPIHLRADQPRLPSRFFIHLEADQPRLPSRSLSPGEAVRRLSWPRTELRAQLTHRPTRAVLPPPCAKSRGLPRCTDLCRRPARASPASPASARTHLSGTRVALNSVLPAVQRNPGTALRPHRQPVRAETEAGATQPTQRRTPSPAPHPDTPALRWIPGRT
jgi:hypothetical protein